MKPRKTVIGAAALSLAVAGSLAGANSAKADHHEACSDCPSPREATLQGVMLKFLVISDAIMEKHEPLGKFSPLENPIGKIDQIIFKW